MKPFYPPQLALNLMQIRHSAMVCGTLGSRAETSASVDASGAVDEHIVGAHDMLGLIAPTIKACAPLLRFRLRIGITSNVNRLAAQKHAGRRQDHLGFTKRTLVRHKILPF